jgi:4-hydroxy-tetrahydrodipicolinate reductase
MIKIVFSGFDGKMGSKILEYIKLHTSYEIVDVINKDTLNPYEVALNGNVVIDFSCKDFSYPLALFCATHHIRFISGTTNFSKEELDEINSIFIQNKIGAIICPNFSKGISLIKKALPLIEENFESIEIEEIHHISKLDSPSGTALQLNNKLKKKAKITSKRKKHYNAIHKITCNSDFETLTIIHKVSNKFAYGELVLKSIEKVFYIEGVKEEII